MTNNLTKRKVETEDLILVGDEAGIHNLYNIKSSQ